MSIFKRAETDQLGIRLVQVYIVTCLVATLGVALYNKGLSTSSETHIAEMGAITTFFSASRMMSRPLKKNLIKAFAMGISIFGFVVIRSLLS